MLGIPSEEVQDILQAQLRNGFAFDGGLGQLALFLLEVEDALFDAVGDSYLVNHHVDGLVEAVDAIDGLFFDEL